MIPFVLCVLLLLCSCRQPPYDPPSPVPPPAVRQIDSYRFLVSCQSPFHRSSIVSATEARNPSLSRDGGFETSDFRVRQA